MKNLIIKEYHELNEKLQLIETQMINLPQGYISKKTIKGRNYFYLQHRVEGKLKSLYIKNEEVESFTLKLELRKKYKIDIPKIKDRLFELEQAAKLIDKSISRELLKIKMSINMDKLDENQKDKSISFADTINAIEGVGISTKTKKRIADWKDGKVKFINVFNETLEMYGFSCEENDAWSLLV